MALNLVGVGLQSSVCFISISLHIMAPLWSGLQFGLGWRVMVGRGLSGAAAGARA
jgi:hypothetical protein